MILLDTCTLIWLMSNEDKLSKKAREMIEHDQQPLFLSSVSALEIGILHQKKRIGLELAVAEWLEKSMEFMAIKEIPVTISIAAASTALDDHHQDPADRIIIATAIENNLTILSPDTNIHRYKNVKVVW